MRTDDYCIGLDVGGANLKLASTGGYCDHASFPLWKQPDELQRVLTRMLDRCAVASNCAPAAIGVTMTGELADCYPTRAAGVLEICKAVSKACPIRPLFYSTHGQWLSHEVAADSPLSLAASNWHALATWIASEFLGKTQRAIILDIGSTTTDIIPVSDGQVATTSLTDRDRLLRCELVYTGMRRTPVATLLSAVTLAGQSCPLMAETFATSDDAYLALGIIGESPGDCDSADLRPRTRQAALQRLARMVGEDHETLGVGAAAIAQQTIDAQVDKIAAAIQHVLGTLKPHRALPTIALSGEGQPLFERVKQRLKFQFKALDLLDLIGPEASQTGPAVATAYLIQRSLRR